MRSEFEILNISACTAVIEVHADTPYSGAVRKVYLNDNEYCKTDNNVIFIEGLTSGEQNEVRIVEDKKEFSISIKALPYSSKLNIEKFGAVGDGQNDNTKNIQAAIMSCPAGGIVIIPRGEFVSGPLFFKSNITLYLEEGAVLKGINGFENYNILPAIVSEKEHSFYLGTWEGEPDDMYASLVNVINVQNFLITGHGTIDGGGAEGGWWTDPKEKKGAWRPRTIFINNSENVCIESVTIRNSPSWTIHPFRSRDIKIYCVKVFNPADSPNTDGINPESCGNVEIRGAHISVGDDCIAIKSGKISTVNEFYMPSKNIIIENCFLESGHGAVVLGSEMSSGIMEVKVQNCIFQGTDRGLRIKTRRGRGQKAVINDINFNNIVMDSVAVPIVINCFYFCDPDGKSEYVQCKDALPVDERTPFIGNVKFKNLRCSKITHAAAVIYGLPEKNIEEVFIEGMSIEFDKSASPGIPAMMCDMNEMHNEGIIIKNTKKVILSKIDFANSEKKIYIENCADVINYDEK